MDIKYKVFSLEEPEKWNEYYNRIEEKDKDVYYTTAIISAFEKFENTQAVLFIYEEDENLVYYPFFKRPIPGSTYFDITTQFTYGGPLFKISENSDGFIKNFRQAFSNYCKDDNIVSELIRFHPFINKRNLLDGLVDFKYVNEGVYMDLEKTPDQINQEYRQNVRYQINKAKRNGFKVAFSKNIKDLDHFFPIYEHTMIRNNANTNYYFLGKDFLTLLIQELKDNFEFIFIMKEDIYVATELVFFSGDYVHAIIGGTLKDYMKGFPAYLLRHELTIKYLDRGQKKLIVGTGITKGDRLFEYKLRFNPKGKYEFHFGMKIHDEEKYNELVNIRKQRDPDKELNGNFFPLYRC